MSSHWVLFLNSMILPMSVSEIVTVVGNDRDTEENILWNPNLCLLPLFLCPIQPTPQTAVWKIKVENINPDKKNYNIVCASWENEPSGGLTFSVVTQVNQSWQLEQREKSNQLEHIRCWGKPELGVNRKDYSVCSHTSRWWIISKLFVLHKFNRSTSSWCWLSNVYVGKPTPG